MIVVVPAATAVTTPVLEIVATEVFEEVQGVALGTVVALKLLVVPIHAFKVPEIIGIALTVKVTVRIQPLEFL